MSVDRRKLRLKAIKADISGNAMSIWNVLFAYINKDGSCFPNMRTIANDSKKSVSSVKRGLRELEKVGLITKTHRYHRNGGQTSNLYEVCE